MPLRQSENRLLAALPRTVFNRLVAQTEDVSFKVKGGLYRAGGPITHVYFPRSGMISMVVRLADGVMSEVGIVGREGMTGVPVFLGAETSPTEVFCQVPSDCRRLPLPAFLDEVGRAGPFQQAVRRYTQALFGLMAQSTACNHHHSIEKRLARWLLMTADRVGADVFPLTQEFLAMMLGVTRPSVTLVAGGLQRAGLFRYHRGVVTVLDRAGLEGVACECYRVVRTEFDRLTS